MSLTDFVRGCDLKGKRRIELRFFVCCAIEWDLRGIKSEKSLKIWENLSLNKFKDSKKTILTELLAPWNLTESKKIPRRHRVHNSRLMIISRWRQNEKDKWWKVETICRWKI